MLCPFVILVGKNGQWERVHFSFSNEIPPLVEILSDRIVITSSGTLPKSLTKEEFFAGISAPRNKELMRVFKDLKMVEHLGSGLQRILKVYDRSIFEFMTNFIKVTFNFGDDFIIDNDVTDKERILLELVKKDNKISITKMAEITE